jgi:hypothetical protein
MRPYIIIIIFQTVFVTHLQGQELETIYSKPAQKGHDLYEDSIDKYKSNDIWNIWAVPLGIPFCSSELSSQNSINYTIKNISDNNLNTAWIEGKSDCGVGEKFGFTFNFSNNSFYGDAYQFYGIINIFNGYCKNTKSWEQNSRIKKLKVYYNNQPICYIEIKDTWIFQSIDISKFFKNNRDKKFLDASYEITNGDKLTFEIIDVYPGSKFKDTAISEFTAEGAGN